MNKQDQFKRACSGGDLQTVKALINDPDAIDPSDNDDEIIAFASSNGHKEVVELLMQDPRFDPSAIDNLAISWAAEDGRKEVVELLMQDSRVDPSDDGNYPICVAADQGHKDIVELLLTDKRVMDKIDDALKRCTEDGSYDLLKGCVDDYKRKKEKERRVQEAIEEMSADCELYF